MKPTGHINLCVLSAAAIALSAWAACAGARPADAQAAPVPLAQLTQLELNAEYNELVARHGACLTLECSVSVDAELDPIRKELMKRNLAALEANGVLIEGVTVEMNKASAALQIVAYRKQCHQNLWRRLRGYREPAWCSQ